MLDTRLKYSMLAGRLFNISAKLFGAKAVNRLNSITIYTNRAILVNRYD